MKAAPSHTPRYVYGIDFGTSNSALAVLDTRQREVVKIFTVPSVLFFPDEVQPGQPPVHFVGDDAVTRYVESERQGRFMKSVKRVLPNKSFEFTRIHGKKYTAEDLVALIIAHLKREADLFVGEAVTTAVIGRPVVFDEHPEKDALAQERLGRAVRQAGIETAFFQLEPIGAAFTYERQLDREELVLVADFGGGTSDFTVMKLRPEAAHSPDRQADMIAKGGIYIGGDNFDSSIMWEKGTPHFGRGMEYESRPGKWLELPLSFFHNICSWEKMN
ncbi:MAG: Hsp70 family protein, partial [Bacteroidetes bacterium]